MITKGRMLDNKMTVLVVAILLLTSAAYAANHCVRAGATGNKSGTDWTNAYTALPATLIRGDTYYIAGGSYPSYTFDDAVSGKTYIYIKKATTSAHGVSTGWNSSYASTQAVFDAPIMVRSSYWDFDGVTGYGKSDYGIKVKSPDGKCEDTEYGIMAPPWASHSPIHYVKLQHFELYGCGVKYNHNQAGFYSVANNSCTNILIANNYIHNYGHAMTIRAWKDCIIEKNYMADGWSSATYHGEALSEGGGVRTVIRYNIFENFFGTSVMCFGKGPDFGYSDSIKVYGNVCFNKDNYGEVGNGSIGVEERELMRGFEIYNNTIINIAGSRTGIYSGTGTGNVAYNNIFYLCKNAKCYADAGGFLNVDNSTFIDCNGDVNTGSSNKKMSGNVFVDWRNGDVNLTQEIPGKSIDIGDAYIKKDLFGFLRGDDGVWDQGAIEYRKNKTSSPPPKNIRFTK